MTLSPFLLRINCNIQGSILISRVLRYPCCMSDFEYAVIPSCAIQIQDHEKGGRLVVSIPTPSSSQRETTNSPHSPAKQSFTNVLLSSALHLPNLPEFSSDNGHRLLSRREPLSLPTTTVNFRRFVARSGPVFWLQDRIEEVIMWRKGWKVTCTWMAIYAFLCKEPSLTTALTYLTNQI